MIDDFLDCLFTINTTATDAYERSAEYYKKRCELIFYEIYTKIEEAIKCGEFSILVDIKNNAKILKIIQDKFLDLGYAVTRKNINNNESVRLKIDWYDLSKEEELNQEIINASKAIEEDNIPPENDEDDENFNPSDNNDNDDNNNEDDG